MSATDLDEVLVLVEGFDDRGFWAGLLLRAFGCVEPGGFTAEEKSRLRPVLHGKYKGAFVYLTSCRRRVVRVMPYQTQAPAGLYRLLDLELSGRTTRSGPPLTAVIVNADQDADAGTPLPRGPADLQSWLATKGHGPVAPLPRGARLPDGTEVHLATWHAPDPPAEDLPAKQTLERIVCAALRDVVPAWNASAHAWLGERPDARGPDHKARAATLWAGWFADGGWGGFHERLWTDGVIAAALRTRLEATGVWALVDALVGEGRENGSE